MYDQNEKPRTLKQRIIKDILKIVLWSIPVSIVLVVLYEVFGIRFFW